MDEKQKAYASFESAIQRILKAAEISLECKVKKVMNAVDSRGVEYQTEMEVMDAYAYDDITDAERRRLLEALEYKENRPALKEDIFISLCWRALRLVDDAKYSDAQERRRREIKGKIGEIKRNGGTALICVCCDDVIGEIDYFGERHEYQNYAECMTGCVCKYCLKMCPGKCKNK